MPGTPRTPHTPRTSHTPHTARTPRGVHGDAASRNFDLAQAAADALSHVKSRKNIPKQFQSALALTAACAPAVRKPLLIALAKCAHRLPDDSKIAGIAELRDLAAEMSREFRKEFLPLLLASYRNNHGDSADSSSSECAEYALQAQLQSQEARQNLIGGMQSPLTEKSLKAIEKALKSDGFYDSDRRIISMVIDGMEMLAADDQERIVRLFADGGIRCEDVIAVLMHTVHGKAIEQMATRTGLSVAALCLGVLTGDGSAMQKLLRILGRIDLPSALHVYLAEGLGALRRALPAASTSFSAALRVILYDIVAISDMSESKRCMLLNAVAYADPDSLHKALTDSVRGDHESQWDFAHRVLAGQVDVGACVALAEIGDDEQRGADLSSYSKFAGKLMNKESVKNIVMQARTWSAKQVRSLILDGPVDVKGFKQAVAAVLASNAAYEAKLALLKGETAAVGDSIALHVAEAGYNTAVRLYKEMDPRREFSNDLAYNVVAGNEKKFAAAYATLTKHFDKADFAAVKAAQTAAMRVAQYSRLPALHVAALSGRSELYLAYLDAAADFASQYDPMEMTGLLALPSNGIPLFNNVTRLGTVADITACMSVILTSTLPQASKVSLLQARTQPHRIGAFYLLMSCGERDKAIAYARSVLRTDGLSPESRVALLRCEKIRLPAHVDISQTVRKALDESALTACAEAERKKHHALVLQFGAEVERSTTLDSKQKTKLQTS